jgi:hypothetical protein
MRFVQAIDQNNEVANHVAEFLAYARSDAAASSSKIVCCNETEPGRCSGVARGGFGGF